jgi:hypothetical protein
MNNSNSKKNIFSSNNKIFDLSDLYNNTINTIKNTNQTFNQLSYNLSDSNFIQNIASSSFNIWWIVLYLLIFIIFIF